ncbi:MAG: S8 family serine peptidase, partial [Holophagales bacterium]|nr:S8 family serine peptidase [Holophagales bacterium]
AGSQKQIKLTLYRSFYQHCAPAVSIVPAIEDAVNKKNEIIIIAAEMRSGNEAIREALLSAIKRQTLIVVGANNRPEEISDEEPSYPASWNTEGLLVVSAINQEKKAHLSFGQTAVDLFAPGQEVPVFDLNGLDTSVGGASPASAIVAALAAITLSQLPVDFPPRGLEKFLVDGATKYTDLKGKARSGGIVNLARTIELAQAEPSQ